MFSTPSSATYTNPQVVAPTPTPTMATVADHTATQAPHTRARAAHLILARIIFGAVLVQVFFAGLGVFNVTGFLPHAILGTTIVLSGLSLPIIAWRGHLGRSLAGESVALALLLILQGLLIDVGHIVSVVAAFHPVNAMIITLVAFHLAFQRHG